MGPGPDGTLPSAGSGSGYGSGEGAPSRRSGGGGRRTQRHTATAPDRLSQLEQRLRTHRGSFASSPPAAIRDFVAAGLPVLDNTLSLFFGAHPSKHIYFVESMGPATMGSGFSAGGGFRGPDGVNYAPLPTGVWGVATEDRNGFILSWARVNGQPANQLAVFLAHEANHLVNAPTTDGTAERAISEFRACLVGMAVADFYDGSGLVNPHTHAGAQMIWNQKFGTGDDGIYHYLAQFQGNSSIADMIARGIDAAPGNKNNSH